MNGKTFRGFESLSVRHCLVTSCVLASKVVSKPALLAKNERALTKPLQGRHCLSLSHGLLTYLSSMIFSPFFSRLLPWIGLLSMTPSCVQQNSRYIGLSPGGGYYVGMSPPSWQFHPWGLVKRGNDQPAMIHRPWSDGSYWHGDGVTGKPRIHISLREQMAYFYKGDQRVGASPVCTGSPEFPTPRGSFRIIEKDADHLSSIYGDYIDPYGRAVQTQIDQRKDPRPPGARFDGAKMHWFMRVTGAVGMHEGYLPGYADSHGCIRLPSHMARVFFANAPLGTPVRITD